MTFIHNPIEFPPITQENRPEGRRYVTPEGHAYPSITTILSSRDKPELRKWRARVGEREANRIAKQSADAGTELHDALEHYLKNYPTTQNLSPDIRYAFKAVTRFLDENVSSIYALECQVYSDTLKAAGTCDFFGEIRDIPVVGDFKTARRMKKREWIDDYFIQTTFYSYAIWERTGIFPRALVIMMTTMEGEFQSFVARPRDWIDTMQKTIDNFHANVYNTQVQ